MGKKAKEETKGRVVKEGGVEYLGRAIFAGACAGHSTAIIAVVNDSHLALLFEVDEQHKAILRKPPEKRDAMDSYLLDMHLSALTEDRLHEPMLELISMENKTEDGENLDTQGWQVFWGFTDPKQGENVDVMRILMFYPPEHVKNPQAFCRPFYRKLREASEMEATYLEIFDREGALSALYGTEGDDDEEEEAA